MNNYIQYLIVANAGLIVFLSIYWLWLKDETQFSMKRAYLLAALLSSSIFPLISITVPSGTNILPGFHNVMASYWLPEIVVGDVQHAASQSSKNPAALWEIIVTGYWLVVVIMALLFILHLLKIILLFSRSQKSRVENYLICESIEQKPIFSFFNFIFIGQSDKLTSSEKDEIIRHEAVHARRLHSLDILLVRSLTIIFWFNPLLRVYRSLLSQLHEYEADANSVQENRIDDYCILLAKVALRSSGFPLANHFSYPLTLKRIQMLKTMKRKIQGWKLVSITAVISLFFFIVACKQSENNEIQKDEVFTVVEEVAVPEGGNEQFMRELNKVIQYPAKARKENTQGTVVLSFIVNKDGTLSDHKVIRSVSPELDDEALRTIKALTTRWKPGRQRGMAVNLKYNLPIKFILPNGPDHGVIVPDLPSSSNETMSVKDLKKETVGGKIEWTGKIVDDSNTGIPGVNIVWIATTNGTVSDSDGNFRIVTDSKATLVASFVGFEVVEIH